jgi:hypothetical protein
MDVPAPRHNVFYVERSGIWSSPNATSCRFPIPWYDEHVPFDFKFQDFRNPRWLTESYPYLAFWPVRQTFDGPLFGRLDISRSTLKIRMYNAEKYGLDPDLIESWDRLEFALLDLAKFLLSRKPTSRSALGLLPLPQDCGYRTTHRTREFVTKCAFKSQRAFVCLATLCSFAIAINEHPSDKFCSTPRWVVECIDRGVHPQWLTLLQNSFVCDFAPGYRAGAYVNAYTSFWAWTFPAFVKSRVPIWIWWGESPVRTADQIVMQTLLPLKEEVAEAKHRATMIPQPGTSFQSAAPVLADHDYDDGYVPMDDDYVPMDAEPAHSVEPVSGSRQRPGETLAEFVQRMDEEKREGLQEEPAEERINRLERERTAERERLHNTLAQPTVGTAMYEWVRGPGGSLSRKLVPREQWNARWRRYDGSTRRYHSFFDEWDLELNNSDDDDDDFDDDDSDDESTMRDFLGPRNANASASFPKLPRLENPSAQVILPRQIEPCGSDVRKYGDDVNRLYRAPVAQTTVEERSLAHVLQFRYGFQVTSSSSSDSRLQDCEKVAASAKDNRAAMTRIGLKNFLGSEFDQAVQDMYNFVVGHGTRPKAFHPIWDFHPRYRDVIMRHPMFQYRRVDSTLHLIGMTGSQLSQQWYVLAIRDACTVMQIFREAPRSLLSTARYLLSQGIPFTTVKFVRRTPSPPPKHPNFGLGHRPLGHIFNTSEYVAYEQAKRDLLEGAFGRVALLRGGIVWRLAKDIVKVKAVTQGPTSSCKTQGNIIGQCDQYNLVDDFLSEEDEDIICGVYHVYTGVS